MAFSNLKAFTAILLLLLPIAAKGDDVPPSLAPFYGNYDQLFILGGN